MCGHPVSGGGIGSFVLNIIPITSFDALARNDVLQVLFFAILFGISLALVGEPAQPVASLIDNVSKVLFVTALARRVLAGDVKVDIIADTVPTAVAAE